MNMMSLKAFIVLLSFPLTLVLSNAVESVGDELYWKSKLGNARMPKVLKAGLRQANDGTPNINYGFQIVSEDPRTYWLAEHVNKNSVPNDGRVRFFTNEMLSKVGTKLKLHFNQITDGSKFLPLDITKSLDFTSNKLRELLNILSVTPNSIEAKYISKMVKECESKGIEDEVRYCALSLKSMVDFVTSNSNSKDMKLMVAATEQEHDILMDYTIQKTQKLTNDDKENLVCHKFSNPFVVFLCHNIRSTDVYGVSLVGENQKQINALAVCHKDTSKWSPGHESFKILNIKAGSKPVCHFISGDTVVWIQN